MALPTLRMPMYRSMRRDDSLTVAHNSRHAEYMADGNTPFSSAERRHQRAVQHQTGGGNNSRYNRPSTSRNGSNSRGSSIANYSRFSDNYNESQNLAARGGQRLMEASGVVRNRNIMLPADQTTTARGNKYMNGSMLDFPRHRIRDNAFENQYGDVPSRGYQDQRYGSSSGITRFKPVLETGPPRSVVRKEETRNLQSLTFASTRKLEGCNTLKDGRDIEAIAPAPAPIKVFDRHGRELVTVGGQLSLPPPLQQNFTALRGRNAAREEYRPPQRRPNQQFFAYQPQLSVHHGGRNNRYQDAYDRGLGSQQIPSAIPAYRRTPLHAKREAGVNGEMDTYDDDFGGSITFFSSTGSNSPSGPSSNNTNSNGYYNNGLRKRRLSPPVDLPPELSVRNYRSSSSATSSNEKRKRLAFPSTAPAADEDKFACFGKAPENNLVTKQDQKASAEVEAEKDKSGVGYHYKKCKLLGRISKNAVAISVPPTSEPLPDRKTSAEQSASPKTASEVHATATAESDKIVIANTHVDANVVVDSLETVLSSAHFVASGTLEVACTRGKGQSSCCPCVLRNAGDGENNGSALKRCCLNKAPASVVEKFIHFRAFYNTRDRCQALLTSVVNTPFDEVTGDYAAGVQPNMNQVSSPTSPAADVPVSDVAMDLAKRDEDVQYEAEHAAFLRKTVAEYFSRIDLLAQLISHAEEWRHLVLHTSKANFKLSKETENSESTLEKAAVLDSTSIVPAEASPTSDADPVSETTAGKSDKAAIRSKQLVLLDSPIVNACTQLHSAVEAGKVRTVLRHLKLLHTSLLNNFGTTGLYQRALYGYQQRKRDKIAANGVAEECSLPKRLFLARSMGTFRRMLTNHRRLPIDKRVDYFLRCVKDCGKLPVYRNIDEALALAATTVDAVISGAVYEKQSSSSSSRSDRVLPASAIVKMRDAVRERITKQLKIGVMMDKVFEQIQKSKREKLLNARSDLCDNQTFLKGLDIVTQTFDKVNQRMYWNEELDLLLGYDEIEEKMLRECRAPLNSYERRSKVSALADEKFRNIDTVEFVLNMNNVPPPVNPYKPLQPPKVVDSTKSFASRFAAYRVDEPRKDFNDYVTSCTKRWTQPQVETFVNSYREHPKYWLEIGRNMSLPTPNDAVMLYRMLKLSTYEYRLLHNLGGSLLTDADFVTEAENDSQRNNAGLLRHARPPYSSSAGAGRKTPIPFSFFHGNNNRPNSVITNGGGSSNLKRPRASEDAAKTLLLLTHPNKFLKTENIKQPWKSDRTAAVGEGGFFSTTVASASFSTTHTSTNLFPATKQLSTTAAASDEVIGKKTSENTEAALCSSLKKPQEGSLDDHSMLSRWSFDLSAVLSRVGISWYQLTVGNNRDVNEQYDLKWKTLARREKSDMVALKRERVKALKSAKREARKNGRNRPQTSTTANTTAVSSPNTAAEVGEENIGDTVVEECAETVAVIANKDDSLKIERTNADFNGNVVACAATNLITAAAVDALLDLAHKETFAPLTTLPSLPTMMTAEELDAVQTPSSEPTTPLSSPPPGLYLFPDIDVKPISEKPPVSTLSPVAPTTPTIESLPIVEFAPVAIPKKRGRRRAADVANSVNNNANANNNVRLSTSASIVAAGAGCGIAKSSTKNVRAAKRTALAAFDNGGRTSNNSAAAVVTNASQGSASTPPATDMANDTAANSIETFLANQALAGLACAASVTSPPSGTMSSAEDDSMPALTPDVDRISRAIEREQKAAALLSTTALASITTRRPYLSQQPLPVKPNMKSSSSSASLSTVPLTDSRKNMFFSNDAVLSAQEVVEKSKARPKKVRRCSLTPPSVTILDAPKSDAPEKIASQPTYAALVSPQRRPLPTKADRLAENASEVGVQAQLPPRSSLMPPHAVLPVKNVNPSDSANAASLTDEKLKSQLVLVKGGGRKKLTGNQAGIVGSKNKKPLIIASSVDTNVVVRIAESSTNPVSTTTEQSQAQSSNINNDSSSFFRTGRHAVTSGGGGSGRVFQTAGGVGSDNNNISATGRRGVNVGDVVRSRKLGDLELSTVSSSSPKLTPSSSSSSLSARLSAQIPQTQQQQQMASTFTGSKFVSQTAQQQVTFGGNKALLKTNAVGGAVGPQLQKAAFPTPVTTAYNSQQFFARSKNVNGGTTVNYAGDRRSSTVTNAESSGFDGGSTNTDKFLSVQHHRHQQHLFQQQQQRRPSNSAESDVNGVHGNNVVFRSSIMMGDRKKRNDGMPSSPCGSNNATGSSSSAFLRPNHKLLMGQGTMFPPSNGLPPAATTKTADLLIDDVLSAYKRSDKRTKTRRGFTAGGDEGEFYENVSDASS